MIQEEPNHFRTIVIEQLQWQIKLVEESSIPDKKEAKEDIIKRFLADYQNNELVNLNTIEEVEEELAKLKVRQQAAKAKDDDEAR